jgi:hypothetical protein
MLCPRCKGTKVITAAHVSYADGSHGYGVDFPCDQCGGKGDVPEEMTEWVRVGREMRDERVQRRVILREEAKQRGMSAVELSRMERGVIQPVPRATDR